MREKVSLMIGLSTFGESNVKEDGLPTFQSGSDHCSGSCSGGGSSGDSGSYPNIESNKDDVDFCMHSEFDIDSEFEENTSESIWLPF